MGINDINSIRNNLLKQKSVGSFSFTESPSSSWSDEIHLMLSTTLSRYDYSVEDLNGQLKIYIKSDELYEQKIFPKLLTPIIVHQLEHFLKKEADRYRRIKNALEVQKNREEARAISELKEIKSEMNQCKKLLNQAINKIGIESAEHCNSLINRLTQGLKSLSEKYSETSVCLTGLNPERDLLKGRDRDFYLHYSKLSEAFEVLNAIKIKGGKR